MESFWVGVLIVVAFIVVLLVFFNLFPLGLWISATASGVKVNISTLIGMRFRRINPAKIVKAYIKATKAGLDVDMNEMEAHFLAGGNVDRVIDALITSQSAAIPLEFE